MHDRHTVPVPGDILWAYFPEEGHATQAKKRPVLVLDIEVQNGLTYAIVAKGTSQHLDAHYLGELRLSDTNALIAAGLSVPTKFQLKRLERLPLTPAWFDLEHRSALPKQTYAAFEIAAQEAGLMG